MKSLSAFLARDAKISEIIERYRSGNGVFAVSGLSGVHKAHLAACLFQELHAPVVYVTCDEFDARRISKDIEAFVASTPFVLPTRELTLHDVEVVSHDYEHERLSALYAMCSPEPNIIVAPAGALLQRTMPKKRLCDTVICVRQGDELAPELLAMHLVELGYTRGTQVDSEGQFAVRGGIVDLFSPYMRNPVRIEFFGDEVDALGEFDLHTQRRIENLSETLLLPATETLVDELSALADSLAGENIPARDEERMRASIRFPALDRYLPFIYPEFTTGLDYISKNAIVLLDDLSRTKDSLERFEGERFEDLTRLFESGVLKPENAKFEKSFSDFTRAVKKRKTLILDTFTHESVITPETVYTLAAKQLPSLSGNPDFSAKEISDYAADGNRVIVMALTQHSAESLRELLETRSVKARVDESLETLPENGEIVICNSTVSAGFEYPSIGLAALSEGRLIKTARRGRDKSNRQRINSYQDLTVGCLVVHELHGIGRFAGIERIEVDKVFKDYIKIIYAGTDALYVPVTQLDLVSKYIGGGEDAPIKLSRLGGTEWQKAKSRAKGAARDLADYLVKLYSKRRSEKRKKFLPDDEWQKEFEDSFEFEETDDQLRCTDEIKADMQKDFPMDRLLCGDVGFGKTEVALRAVMKSVLSGRQVAILVPTTVLAEQHYLTATSRLSKYPIKVEVLSRFRSNAQNAATIKGVKNGQIDVVIGTHKLLQKSVEFNKLGLLVVDEEQRFGVTHKERLKEISEGVDVLTLSATPIPRTLNMALSGIRDMSIIEEPPMGRHPVQTYVSEQDWDVVADAIRREVSRGGQVYYVHNRVASIEQCALRIGKLVPQITIGIAHGRMDEEELSDVMRRMSSGEIQVLVCTTIIETGIDIANVNTLIIEDADNMGLSQLHQLRGRVGRSPRHAYAYLMYRRGRGLTEIAEKRLSAVREYVEFGSGFKIAMRDLELRGAGNLLGAEQSGHMMSVGYDMYLKLLEEAVNDARGEKKTSYTVCSADFTVTATIPDSYVAASEQRMDIYRQIASVSSREEAEDMLDELIDRFGEPPQETIRLIEIALLRHDASRAGISDITQKGDALKITMVNPSFENISRLCSMREYKGKILLNAGSEPYLMLKLTGLLPLEAAKSFVKDYMKE